MSSVVSTPESRESEGFSRRGSFLHQAALSLCVPSRVHPRVCAICRDSDFYSLEFLSLIVFKLPLLFVKDTDVWPWRKTR